ncbi:hypothetical protein ACVWW6_004228 [Bradyrhizobium sp. USDA 3311]|nr:hypothetical protein [Bradyrhizobium sp. CCBAU 45394]
MGVIDICAVVRLGEGPAGDFVAAAAGREFNGLRLGFVAHDPEERGQ